jgi:hypothetical protein
MADKASLGEISIPTEELRRALDEATKSNSENVSLVFDKKASTPVIRGGFRIDSHSFVCRYGKQDDDDGEVYNAIKRSSKSE